MQMGKFTWKRHDCQNYTAVGKKVRKRMYKIIVADDNLLTIQALQATVPWEEWGFQL